MNGILMPSVVELYTPGRPLSCDVLFCFLSEVPVTNWAAQYLQFQPNGRSEHVKTAAKNITTEQTPHCVCNQTLVLDLYGHF